MTTSKDLLRRLRNDLPMAVTIAALGREGPPAKMSEGYFRFLCPHCGEMRRREPADQPGALFLLPEEREQHRPLAELDYDFRSAVALLERWLTQYEAQQARRKRPSGAWVGVGPEKPEVAQPGASPGCVFVGGFPAASHTRAHLPPKYGENSGNRLNSRTRCAKSAIRATRRCSGQAGSVRRPAWSRLGYVAVGSGGSCRKRAHTRTQRSPEFLRIREIA